MTETGDTPLMMSRISSALPIFAFTRHEDTQNRVALFRGVQAVPFKSGSIANEQINQRAVDELKRINAVVDGDLVIITKGDYANVHGGTNTLKIVKAGEGIQ